MAEIDKKRVNAQEEEDEEESEDEPENAVPQVNSVQSAKESEESAKSTGIPASEESNEEIDEGKLPFPRATITKLIRKDISKGKQIKGTVKDEMNLWVSTMVERIAKKMDSQPYTYVNYDMLKDAVAPYEDIQGINKQREELVKKINSIKGECDSVINELDKETKSKAVFLKIDSEDLPFPKATITNKLRKFLDERKTIKGPVKRGLNVWMGSIVSRVAKKMDSFPYPYVDRSMFKEAIEPYEAVGEIELEKERIIQQMQSVKTACDLLVMEIERKFRL